MTDKQIIIDDVDVSKCNYFNNTDKSYCEECCSEFGCAICNDRPNCYYKQLARKEQECEKLKEALTEIRKIAEKEVKHAPDGETFARPEIKQILQKISECEAENEK